MTETEILRLLESVRSGSLSPKNAMERLKNLPFEDLDFAKVDHHRALRQGFAEVVFGKGKTADHVGQIVKSLLGRKASGASDRQNILVTRADQKMFAAVKRVAGKNSGKVQFHPLSGAITIERNKMIVGKGIIAVVTAGTSDIPVAEEAMLTARLMGNQVEHVFDVGVAGIHRLLAHSAASHESSRGHLCGRHGRCVAQRGRRPCRCSGHRRPHQCRLRRQFRGRGRTPRNAEQLRL